MSVDDSSKSALAGIISQPLGSVFNSISIYFCEPLFQGIDRILIVGHKSISHRMIELAMLGFSISKLTFLSLTPHYRKADNLVFCAVIFSLMEIEIEMEMEMIFLQQW